MFRCLAIADDLSGAAEIAGIGHRFGLAARIVRDRPPDRWDVPGLTVLDTDSRSPQCEPELRSARALHAVLQMLSGCDAGGFELVYKKVDSVLRGYVVAETSAIAMTAFGRSPASWTPAGISARPNRIVLLPQNPTRGRVIDASGEYRIDGALLHRTDFARDPDHPARSSRVGDLLGDASATCVTVDQEIPEHAAMVVAAATSPAHVARWAQRVASDRTMLPAGSGDFFTALLAARGLQSDRKPAEVDPPGRRLFLCGSASETARALPALAASRGVALCPMPDDVFAGRSRVDAWAGDVAGALERSLRVLAFIPQSLDRSATAQLQSAIADLAAGVLARTSVENLLLEGGATAAAVCRRMNWDAFDVTGELAPGVVRLRAGEQTLIIKPGSYPWPQSVWGTA
jgi:uncharacterized protein YgbK (DUF1537 family)